MDANEELSRLRKLQASRLKEARLLRGYKTAAECARRFHWTQSTYTHHENATRAIGRRYREYAKKLKVNAAWLLGEDVERDATVQGVAVTGSAQLGVWHENRNGALPEGTPKRIPVPTQEGVDLDERFAIRIADGSINKAIPQGGFAICAHADGDTVSVSDLKVGQIVYIERMREDMTEFSFRRVVTNDGKTATLATWSADPRLRQEIAYPSRNGESVAIVGYVVGKYEDLSPA